LAHSAIALKKSAVAMKKWHGLLAVAGLVTAYSYGAASYAFRLFPIEHIGALKRSIVPDDGRKLDLAVFSDTKGRDPVSCWSIEPDAAVILAMGQSNAGNYGETRYRPVQQVFNFNWLDGKCYRAEDPLLGSTGDRGSVWTRLGDALIESKRFKQVVIVPIGIGGSSVRDWAGPHGPAQRAVDAQQALSSVGLHITHVLWHQGEADFEMHKDVYSRLFAHMTEYIRSHGINAPVFVATATICNNTGADQIREAQRELPFKLANVYAGPDTDALDSIYDRKDNLCHFSDRGLALHARMWRDVILRYQEARG
jgi:hypothetical protein